MRKWEWPRSREPVSEVETDKTKQALSRVCNLLNIYNISHIYTHTHIQHRYLHKRYPNKINVNESA